MEQVDFDDELFPPFLPHWADKKLDGEFELYAQLSTVDGRRMGNAVIIDVVEKERLPWWIEDMAPLFEILTDFGHRLRLTSGELADLYHPPKWRMIKTRVEFRIEFMKGYLLRDQSVCDAFNFDEETQ